VLHDSLTETKHLYQKTKGNGELKDKPCTKRKAQKKISNKLSNINLEIMSKV